MAPLSNILAWRIPRTEEPGGYSPGVTKSQTQAKRERARMQSLPRKIQISEALNSRIRSQSWFPLGKSDCNTSLYTNHEKYCPQESTLGDVMVKNGIVEMKVNSEPQSLTLLQDKSPLVQELCLPPHGISPPHRLPPWAPLHHVFPISDTAPQPLLLTDCSSSHWLLRRPELVSSRDSILFWM